MGRLLKDYEHIQELHEAVQKCSADVYLIKNDGSEQFNLKSALSEFIALGRLAEKYGDQYEIFCQNAADEAILMRFYRHLREEEGK